MVLLEKWSGLFPLVWGEFKFFCETIDFLIRSIRLRSIFLRHRDASHPERASMPGNPTVKQLLMENRGRLGPTRRRMAGGKQFDDATVVVMDAAVETRPRHCWQYNVSNDAPTRHHG
jgi:hypothetical protein